MPPMTLIEARRRKRWTLDALAIETGLNKSTLSRLERGLTRPMYATVRLLERALDTRIDFGHPDRS